MIPGLANAQFLFFFPESLDWPVTSAAFSPDNPSVPLSSGVLIKPVLGVPPYVFGLIYFLFQVVHFWPLLLLQVKGGRSSGSFPLPSITVNSSLNSSLSYSTLELQL